MVSQEIEGGEKIAFSTPNDWDLIKLIAQFLSRDPRHSVKELVDNALDAFSRVSQSHAEDKVVNIVIRKKDRYNPHIKFSDNGYGWPPHNDPADPKFGRPDFEYTVKHVGDSIKKYLVEYDKARREGSAVGEFAIGLFSFWALGERLTVYSRSALDGKLGPCSMMVWHKQIEEATIKHDVDPPSELSTKAGSVIIIDHLEKAQMNLVTGNILAKYLSRACRTLLMKSNASLTIDDHGTKFRVIPTKYEGTKFPLKQVETTGGFGPIYLEIYAFPPVESQDEFRVPVFCKGARAYDDITELPELNIFPWSSKKVYGEINYPHGTLSPSRTGFVNDSFLDAFIKTMQSITAELAQFVDEIEARKKAKQRDRFHAVFHEKWQEIFKMLSEEWRRKGTGPPPPPPPPPPPAELGPMYRVEISPNEPKVACLTVSSLTARPYDINGNILRDPSLIYYWQLTGKPLGLLKDDTDKTCHFQVGSHEGITTLTLTVFQYVEVEGKEQTVKKTASTNIWVVNDLPPPPPPRPTGDRPPSLLEDNLNEDGPHSVYEPQTLTIKVNDHHEDYVKAKEKDDQTLYRYINFCFAKEIAVDRFGKTLDPHELSEKTADLIALSERMFDWEELVKKRRGRPPKEAEAAWTSRALVKE